VHSPCRDHRAQSGICYCNAIRSLSAVRDVRSFQYHGHSVLWSSDETIRESECAGASAALDQLLHQ
ncbi:hypothetical protein ANCCEY_15865, partial [Ancylostoma ceylanicum]